MADQSTNGTKTNASKKTRLATLHAKLAQRDETIALLRRDTVRTLDVTRAAQRLRRVLAKEPRDPAEFALAARELGDAVDAFERDPGGHEKGAAER